MANGTFYVDGVNGSDANDGLSEANAKQTLAAGVGLFAGGGNILHVQATGNYVLTSGVSMPVGDTTDGPNVIEGYTTTPGARDGRPTITSSTNSVALFEGSTTGYFVFRHLHLTHTAATRGPAIGNAAFDFWNWILVDDCLVDGCSSLINTGRGPNGLFLFDSVVKNCSSWGVLLGASIGNTLKNSKIFNCTSGGIQIGDQGSLEALGSIIAKNGGVGLNIGSSNRGPTLVLFGCIVANNTGDGFILNGDPASAGTSSLRGGNNIIYSNGGYGGNTPQSAVLCEIRSFFSRNAYGSNTSGNLNNWPTSATDIALTADPFVDAANGNFNLNDTAGGGAALRAVTFGLPG